METIARQRSHHPRRAFHSISHVARVWFLGGLVFCRIAVAVVVVCVEPRGPASPIGVLDIQMTAVMRREFGTAEPPSSEVELGRGRANGLVHVHFLPPVGRSLFDKNIQNFLLFRLRFCAKPRNRTIELYTLPIPMSLRARAHLYNTQSGLSPREVPFRSIDLGEVALRPYPT